jgi:hypothetical protein
MWHGDRRGPGGGPGPPSLCLMLHSVAYESDLLVVFDLSRSRRGTAPVGVRDGPGRAQTPDVPAQRRLARQHLRGGTPFRPGHCDRLLSRQRITRSSNSRAQNPPYPRGLRLLRRSYPPPIGGRFCNASPLKQDRVRQTFAKTNTNRGACKPQPRGLSAGHGLQWPTKTNVVGSTNGAAKW